MNIVECEHLADGICSIATVWANRPARVTKGACAACVKQHRPKARNSVTASMAIAAYVLADPKEKPPEELILDTNVYLKNAIPTEGVGTELKKLLEWFRLHEESLCTCKQKAIIMDTMGIDECVRQVETVLDWLKEAAEERNVFYFRPAARILFNLAVVNARGVEYANNRNGDA